MHDDDDFLRANLQRKDNARNKNLIKTKKLTEFWSKIIKNK